MIWARRRFGLNEDCRLQMDLIAKLMEGHPRRFEFIMVSVSYSHRNDEVYIGVPSEIFANVFEGFEHVDENEVPKVIDTVLVAFQTEEPFKSRFKFRHNL